MIVGSTSYNISAHQCQSLNKGGYMVMKKMNRFGYGMVLVAVMFAVSVLMLGLATDASAAAFPEKGRAIQVIVN